MKRFEYVVFDLYAEIYYNDRYNSIKRLKHMKRLICIILVLSSLTFIPAAAAETDSMLDVINTITKWENTADSNTDIITNDVISNTGTNIYDWFAFSSGRLGADNTEKYDIWKNTLADTLNNDNSFSVPDYERLALCCAACGSDIAENELLQKAVFDNFTKADLSKKIVNQLIYALLTLDSHCYKIPESVDLSRYDLICEILSRQRDNGALWMMNENTSETDLTAMMITALSPYANGGELFTYTQNNVEKSVTIREAIEKALEYLSTAQSDDGTMINWGSSSCETTAQTIIALTTYGIDIEKDSRFIKNGNTLFDGMTTYRLDNGAFAHSFDGAGNADGYATTQALYTCIALLRNKNGYRDLFDMQKEFSPEQNKTIRSITENIDSISTPDNAEIKNILDDCCNLSVCDRRYIKNFSKLEDILKEYNIENTAAYTAEELGINMTYECTVTNITSPLVLSEESLEALNDNYSKLEASSQSIPQNAKKQNPYTAFACICGITAAAVLVFNRKKRSVK